MSGPILDILRKIFGREEASLVAWLQKKKLILFAAIVAVAAIWVYTSWPHVFNSLLVIVVDLLNWLLLVWLIIVTLYLYRRERVGNEKEFKDDFRHGLEKWEYYGDWRSERDNGDYILIVTNSDTGGLAKPCRLWNDYVFEFETKIVQANSSWIIRAADILNYVMLQCGQTEITPHFRVGGQWFKMQSIPLTTHLPLNEWIKVRITVSGTRVVAKVTLNGKEMTVLDQRLLEPKVVSIQIVTPNNVTQPLNFAFSFPLGSVGFREWGNIECAQFRNVRVAKTAV